MRTLIASAVGRAAATTAMGRLAARRMSSAAADSPSGGARTTPWTPEPSSLRNSWADGAWPFSPRAMISRAPALVASSNTPTRKSLMKAALGLE